LPLKYLLLLEVAVVALHQVVVVQVEFFTSLHMLLQVVFLTR
jgi:hypothetical protein